MVLYRFSQDRFGHRHQMKSLHIILHLKTVEFGYAGGLRALPQTLVSGRVGNDLYFGAQTLLKPTVFDVFCPIFAPSVLPRAGFSKHIFKSKPLPRLHQPQIQ